MGKAKRAVPAAVRRTTVAVIRSRRGLRRWYFHAVAGNGEIITASEAYVTSWNARRAARRAFPGAELIPGWTWAE